MLFSIQSLLGKIENGLKIVQLRTSIPSLLLSINGCSTTLYLRVNCWISVLANNLKLLLLLQRNMLLQPMMIRFNCYWERFARCPNNKPNFRSIYWTSSNDFLKISDAFLTSSNNFSLASKPSLILNGSSSRLQGFLPHIHQQRHQSSRVYLSLVMFTVDFLGFLFQPDF